MYIVNRQYMDVEFPLTNGGSVIINGANIQAVQLGLGEAFGITYIEDAVWDEIKTKYSHIINQGYIFADKQEKSAKAKYEETKKIKMQTDPVDPNATGYKAPENAGGLSNIGNK
jgi:hypothetical protein